MVTHVLGRVPGAMLLSCLIAVMTSTTQSQTTMVRPTDLRCEFLADPLGIDNPQPRLGWILDSGRRGERQTAYRILVASSASKLSSDQGDLWDSGRVPGDQTSLVSYRGRTLASHQYCFWKVMAWDRDGRVGSWSAPSSWSMGILSPSGWSAAWIGFDEPRRNDAAVPFSSARWIWFAGDKAGEIPASRRAFVRVLDLSDGGEIEAGDLAVTADDRFRFFLNGTLLLSSVSGEDSWKSPGRKDIASLLRWQGADGGKRYRMDLLRYSCGGLEGRRGRRGGRETVRSPRQLRRFALEAS
jgi:alpha-L-rhamnosidase